MSDSADSNVPQSAIKALQAVLPLLGNSVVGAHLYGSAVAGGLRPDSDVDVLVTVSEGLPVDVRTQLIRGLMEASGRMGEGAAARPLEVTFVRLADVVPWHYPPRKELLYGEWLRGEFERGRIPAPAHDPDLAVVLAQARERSIPLVGPGASELFDPIPVADLRRAIRDSLPSLIGDVKGDERNVLLTLARMWLTAATGEIAPKDVAAKWAATRLSSDHASMLAVAGRAYLGQSADDWRGQESAVLALVTSLRREIEACLDRAP